MSEAVKLIIEIPTGGVFERDIYTPICAEGFIRDEYNEKVAEAIKNGIPLDDVKAEIGQIYQEIDTISHNEYENAVEQGKEIAYENVLSILDNIGKGDKE